MVTTNDYFITQMKLRALREQRSRLLHTYNELRLEVARQSTETRRLEVLYEGLRQITFANQKLHPDVANLEPMLEHTGGGPISMEAMTFWYERLEKELGNGQLRSEIVYLFGSMLEERALASIETAETRSQHEQLRADLVERLLHPAETRRHADLLHTVAKRLNYPNMQKGMTGLLQSPEVSPEAYCRQP